MANLNDDVVERILKRREVYVVVKRTYDYECSASKVLGIFGIFKDAQAVVVRDALSGLDFNYYDPTKRYFELEETMKIIDRWVRHEGISDYDIEVWKQDVAHEGLHHTFHFNFDAYLKNMIADDLMPSHEVKRMLCSWVKRFPEELYGVFSEEEARFRSSTDRQAWRSTFGHKNAHPFGDDTCVEMLDE